jgi:hypothetical protein
VSIRSTLLGPQNRAVFFAASGGVGSVVLGLVLLDISRGAGFSLIALGIVVWVLAGTADRWERFAVDLLGLGLEANLARKEHGNEFKEAAKDAPDGVLESVIPLLRQDVASDVLEVGQAFHEKRLVDPELTWLRQDLNVTVFAIQRPGDGEAWVGGGQISAMSLPMGTRLAVLGDRPDIDLARNRLAQPGP